MVSSQLLWFVVASHTYGRGAFYAQRRSIVRLVGAHRSENVGMSNHNRGEKPLRRKPKVSSAMVINGGLGVPKDNPA